MVKELLYKLRGEILFEESPDLESLLLLREVVEQEPPVFERDGYLPADVLEETQVCRGKCPESLPPGRDDGPEDLLPIQKGDTEKGPKRCRDDGVRIRIGMDESTALFYRPFHCLLDDDP